MNISHHHYYNYKIEITTSCYRNTEAGPILEYQGKLIEKETQP